MIDAIPLRQEGHKITRRKKGAWDAARCGSLKIALFVANKYAATHINRPSGQQAPEHAGLRLAAAAPYRILWDDAVFMVWTIHKFVHMGAVSAQFVLHGGVKQPNAPLRKIPSRHTGLVGDDKHKAAIVVAPAHGFNRAVDPT
jgi:hypothetical protein